MDPDANLAELRRLAASILNHEELDGRDDHLRLAELVEALDEWLQKGGSLPREWAAVRRR